MRLIPFSLSLLLGVSPVMFPLASVFAQAEDPASVVVNIPDPTLEAKVKEELGIGDRQLTQADMLELTELNLSYEEYTESDVRIQSIEGLQYATNLEVLELGDNDISDITPLQGLEQLSSLSLNGNKLRFVAGSADQQVLEALYAQSLQFVYLLQQRDETVSEIADVRDPMVARIVRGYLDMEPGESLTKADLGELTDLQLLYDWSTAEPVSVDSLKGLEDAINLTAIEAGGRVDDLTPLADLSRLYDVSITTTEALDLTPLGGLEKLEYLTIGGPVTWDLAVLESMDNLHALHIEGGHIVDLAPIVARTNLGSLTLRNLGLSDLSFLTSLSHLYQLDVSGNRLTDLSPIREMTHILYLTIDDNYVEDLSPVADFSGLRHLSFNGNRVSDLTPMEGLAELTNFSADFNDIEDVTPLAALSLLTSEVHLQGNRIRDISPLGTLPRYAVLYLRNNLIEQVPTTEGFSERILFLDRNRLKGLAPMPSGMRYGYISMQANQALLADIPYNPYHETIIGVQYPLVIEDTDADGMDDAWESYYFGSLERDGTADSDGDGRSDADEELAGTDPEDADDYLTVSLEYDFDRWVLRFEPFTPSRTYTVYWGHALSDAGLQPLTGISPRPEGYDGGRFELPDLEQPPYNRSSPDTPFFVQLRIEHAVAE
ncbi:MAG: putative internalin A [Puniceicoccaceae bacterium 5H]|nr:MAG: putative internalin A [Puniceicoccaceae bacterium 5H]